VVAIPTNFDDGQGESYSTAEALAIAANAERTRDVQYLMTQMVADSQQSGKPAVRNHRPDQIAVSGHSLGGFAALALAGGDDQAL